MPNHRKEIARYKCRALNLHFVQNCLTRCGDAFIQGMRTLALLLTTIVLNCSSSQSYVSQISGLAPASGTIPPDQARVVILRPDNNRGWTRAEIRISPTALLSLYGGRYLAYDCPPGKFTLKSSAEWSTTALQQMMRSTSTYIPVYTYV